MPDESDYERWLDDILTKGVNLSAWEEDFIESIEAKRASGQLWRLSDKQAEILERIYSKRTS